VDGEEIVAASWYRKRMEYSWKLVEEVDGFLAVR
jgi:hypothetical protein